MITARDLSNASLEADKTRQCEAWFDLFAKDAMAARDISFDYKIREKYAYGNEDASAAAFKIGSADSATNTIDLITINKINATG